MDAKLWEDSDLADAISRHFDTTMIGALADFEKHFGHLWGHNEKRRTPEQQEMRKRWLKARESILDRGNLQKKNAIDKVNGTPVKQQHHYTLLRGDRR